MRPDALAFLEAAPEIRSTMIALSAAESLTDDVARLLIAEAVPTVDPDRFVRALHACDFVLERNSEWQLTTDVREGLLRELVSQEQGGIALHQILLGLAGAPADDVAGIEVPRYLRHQTGRAYHTAFLAPSIALHEYAAVAMEPLTGEVWLAGRLAREQQEMGILPPGAVEIDFLEGMRLWKENRRDQAEPILRRIANSSSDTIEVAIAAHLVGSVDGRRPRYHRRGEELLRRSLALLEQLHDRHGEAQVLHTLGHLVGRDSKRRAEAEELLRRSLAIGEELQHRHHQAQVLHTLGQLVGRDFKRRAEAEELLRRSLALRETPGDMEMVRRSLRALGIDPESK
jgi:hypothetical protein